MSQTELFSKKSYDIKDVVTLLQLRERKTRMAFMITHEDAHWFYVQQKKINEAVEKWQ